jgi:hypothetical protein
MYYIIEVLTETKARDPQTQKLLYVVVLARRKLRHYFEAHPFTVVSLFPLGEIISNPDAVGRIAKWSVELMGKTLAYALRKVIKSQILADFVAEWTDAQLPPPQIPALLGCTGTRHRHNGHCATYEPSSTAPSNRPTTAPVNQMLHRRPRSRSCAST